MEHFCWKLHSTAGLKMSCNSYKDNISSIIKTKTKPTNKTKTQEHQTRSFYCALYLFSLGRGETSGFSFVSSCASVDVAAVALATTCSCGCDGVMGICGVGPLRPLQSHPSWCHCLLVAEVPAWPFFLRSPGEGEQPKCLSTASPSLETFLWRSKQQGKEALIFLSGLDKPHFIKAFCICQISVADQELFMQAQLGPWTPSRQCVIMYSVCTACFLHSGYSVNSLSTAKLSCIKERGKKIKLLFVFSESFKAKQAAPSSTQRQHSILRSCSWNTFPCTITTEQGEGWHESW